MTGWIFDLDGVVTHLTEKKIIHPQLLQYFAKILQKEEPLTINTGRSLAFIRQEVLNPLLSYMKSKKIPEDLLDNFFAVGEKGNAWIADEKDYFDKEYALPNTFTKQVKQLIARDFSETMFFDTTKQTMISIEVRTKLSLTIYKEAQNNLLPLLDQMLTTATLNHHFRIDPSVSAVDIQAKTAGKGKGAERILQWLKAANKIPDHFVAIGDSFADIETGEKLHKCGEPFTFIFVGEKALLANKYIDFPVTFTNKLFDEGTAEFLKRNLS